MNNDPIITRDNIDTEINKLAEEIDTNGATDVLLMTLGFLTLKRYKYIQEDINEATTTPDKESSTKAKRTKS